MTLLVFMGSGETAPAMVKTHRDVFASTRGDGPAVMLDTPFGFQANADDLIAKTQLYFRQSVGNAVSVASWRRADAPVADRERALAVLSEASWVFAGPGSPTYALRQWRDTPVPAALLDVANRGGTLVFGSAAAVTAGTHAIPVYEIYKVGAEPSWEAGLDMLGTLTGVSAVVVPHFDNAEGRNYDTRFCFLGESRLATLEAALPDYIGILGVDEHTAAVIDVTARTMTVSGIGRVTVRRRAVETTFPTGSVVGLDELAGLLAGTMVEPTHVNVPVAIEPVAAAMLTSLRAVADEARAAFDAALASRDVDGCVTAVLRLETSIQEWATDALTSDDGDHARRVLRALVVRLGDLAHGGARDPRDLVGPYVELAIELRARARAAKDFATSDLVRDRLAAAGAEVRDSPDGTTWVLN
ncbi:MAG: hypothetical protein QOG52_2147 [Frankiaceae bacterium]|nr:hypothetical protein [Frankiaceae bacterium]